MNKLEKYSSYKDSGVVWLGEIPEHWEVKKIKHIGKIKSGDAIVNNELKDSGKYEVFGGNGLMGYCNRYNVTNENFIIGRVGAYCGNVRFNNQKRWISDNALIFSLFKDESYNYVFHLLTASRLNSLNSSNAQPLITGNKVINFNIPYPPRDEQTKIASFLDEKTAQIDEVISQKEKLIELLKERKQIVINDAVTKGLDKDVKFVDSGVEWIGKIPKLWKISKLGTSLKPISIKNRADLPLLSVTREQGVILRDVDDKESNHNFIPDDLSGYKMVEKGQFAMNKMKAWQGSYGISDYTGIVSPAYFIFELNGIESTFFHKAIRSSVYVTFFIKASDGVRIGQWDLSKSRMKEIPFYIPPKDEQLQIVEHIENQTTKIDKAIELQQNYISKLKEYKASLIDSVVTGKVRVV